MGEVAALSSAFDSEFNKHYEALAPRQGGPEADAHDSFLNHYRQVRERAEKRGRGAAAKQLTVSLLCTARPLLLHTLRATLARCYQLSRRVSTSDRVQVRQCVRGTEGTACSGPGLLLTYTRVDPPHRLPPSPRPRPHTHMAARRGMQPQRHACQPSGVCGSAAVAARRCSA